MKLSKSVDEYLAAGGWSSHKFFEHAKSLFSDPDILRTCTFEAGRSVIYIRSRGEMLKLYVHHSGRSREWVTIKNMGGDELVNFHCTISAQSLRDWILDYFDNPEDHKGVKPKDFFGMPPGMP
jgi:hypothetical protein